MEIVKSATLYGQNSNSDHAQNQSKNRVEITKLLSKQLIIWRLQKCLNLPKYMIEILGQATPKSATQIGSKLPQLCFTRHIHGFYCESSLQYEDGKNSKAYQNLWWES